MHNAHTKETKLAYLVVRHAVVPHEPHVVREFCRSGIHTVLQIALSRSVKIAVVKIRKTLQRNGISGSKDERT